MNHIVTSRFSLITKSAENQPLTETVDDHLNWKVSNRTF